MNLDGLINHGSGQEEHHPVCGMGEKLCMETNASLRHRDCIMFIVFHVVIVSMISEMSIPERMSIHHNPLPIGKLNHRLIGSHCRFSPRRPSQYLYLGTGVSECRTGMATTYFCASRPFLIVF